MNNDSELIDQIYECSFISELWPSVLGRLANLATARTGFLFVSNGDEHNWTTSRPDLAASVDSLVKRGWIARSDRFRRLLSVQHPGFVREGDIYEEEEMGNDPFYRDYLYPRGLGWA